MMVAAKADAITGGVNLRVLTKICMMIDVCEMELFEKGQEVQRLRSEGKVVYGLGLEKKLG